MLRVASWTNSCRTSLGGCSDHGGAAAHDATASMNPRNHGRAPLLRVVSGMPLCLCWPPPPSPACPSRANRESLDFTLKGNRAKRVQIVNVTHAQFLARTLMLAVAVETLGMARHVVQIDLAERQPESLLGGRQDRQHDVGDKLGIRLLGHIIDGA